MKLCNSTRFIQKARDTLAVPFFKENLDQTVSVTGRFQLKQFQEPSFRKDKEISVNCTVTETYAESPTSD